MKWNEQSWSRDINRFFFLSSSLFLLLSLLLPVHLEESKKLNQVCFFVCEIRGVVQVRIPGC